MDGKYENIPRMMKTGSRYKYACPVENQRLNFLGKERATSEAPKEDITISRSISIHAPVGKNHTRFYNKYIVLTSCNQIANKTLKSSIYCRVFRFLAACGAEESRREHLSSYVSFHFQ